MEQKSKRNQKRLAIVTCDNVELAEESRQHLLSVIRFALSQNFKYRPRKQEYYLEDDFRSWANQILEHMELTGIRFFKENNEGPRHFKPEKETDY